MDKKKDTVEWISLSLAKDTVYIHRFGESALVSLCRSNVSAQKYIPVIERAIFLLGKSTSFKFHYCIFLLILFLKC